MTTTDKLEKLIDDLDQKTVGSPREYVLHLLDVHKSYDDGRVQVLHDLDLKITEGEFVTLVGPSGCGKSTLLRAVLGEEDVTEGTATIRGSAIKTPDVTRGIVYQDHSLFPHLTAWQNVMMGPKLQQSWWKFKKVSEADKQLAREYLERAGMSEHLDKKPYELSGGQKQRIAIIQALMAKPEILLMDEPFSALDETTREDMQLLLLELYEQTGMTILFITHDLTEALYLGTRNIALSQYYVDGRGDETKGARIVSDIRLREIGTAISPSEKSSPKLHALKDKIRAEAFDPDHIRHAKDFTLTHPDSFQTLTEREAAVV